MFGRFPAFRRRPAGLRLRGRRNRRRTRALRNRRLACEPLEQRTVLSVVLDGAVLDLGINDDGSLITEASYLGGVGASFNEAEFLTWGSPWALLSVSADGETFTNVGPMSSPNPFSVTVTDTSSVGTLLADAGGSTLSALVEGTVTAGLQLERTVAFASDSSVVRLTVTLTNAGSTTLENVAFMEAADPDQGWYFGQGYRTYNDVVLDGDFVRANTVEDGSPTLTFGLGSADPRATASVELWAPDPTETVQSPYDPDGSFEDRHLHLAFDFGTLAPGESVTAEYAMVFAATPEEADALYLSAQSEDEIDAAPVVEAIVGPDVAVPNQPLVYSAEFTDLGDPGPHTATVDWGDGSASEATVVETGSSGTASASHHWTQVGTYTVTLTVKDAGGNETTVEKSVAVQQAVVADDPERPGEQALFVGGSEGNDKIRIKENRHGKMRVKLNGGMLPDRFSPTPGGYVYVYAGDGNDHVKLLGNVRHDGYIDGGAGNDKLLGGRRDDRILGGEGNDRLKGFAGNDLLDGGAGNDRLKGQNGNDVLIGGDGADRLFGNRGSDLLIGGLGADALFGGGGGDILIGGTTDHDAQYQALAAVMAEWSQPLAIDARIENLENGTGLNGAVVLTSDGTVTDDGAPDALYGGGGGDWFLYFDPDSLHGKNKKDRGTE